MLKNDETYFNRALSGLWQFLANDSPLTVMKNAFYFTLKNSFHSRDIQTFVLTFWSCRKTA